MNPIARFLSAVADRLHPDADAQAAALGLTVTYRPDGTRVVHHPDMAAIAAAHRARILTHPDALDRLFISPAVIAQTTTDRATHAARVTATTTRSMP